jgi:anionic cell wall polymer biosynthesis LytR-Cps2A-Psr (LCP) family protein
MNGHLALAYARSRHQDDDYHRMERQQLVLLALRRAVKPCALVPRLPELIDIAGDSLWTNLSVHDMPDILALAQRVDTRRIVRYALVPPTIPEYLDTRSVANVHAMVANAFKALATSTPTPRPVPSLPGGPTPTPTPQDDGC